jgi:hydrogenase-4 component E
MSMSGAVDPVLVLVILLNFYALGTSRVDAVINAVALQGAVLGALAVLVHGFHDPLPLLLGMLTLMVKGVAIPMMLRRAMREVAIRREVEPYIAYVPSLLACAAGTAMSFLFARHLPLASQHTGSILVPAALATVTSGFLVIATRRKAITQVAGYLVLENGVFVMGLGLLEAMPFLVEVGILLDLFVAIFVMGIILHHVSREFASLDTGRLSDLKE